MGVEPAPRPGTDDAGRPGARARVGPCQSSSCCLRSFRTLTARVWPVAVGRRVRTSYGAFRGRGLRVARGREAALPSRGQPVVERSASRECLYESGPSTWPTRPIVSPVLCESSVWHQEPKEIEPVVLVRSVVSCLHPHLCLLSASRSCSDRSGGWMWLGEHFAAPG